MNVILYLDKNRMSEETEIRRVNREDYRLIFANFSTDAGKWFGQPFPEPLPDETEEKKKAWRWRREKQRERERQRRQALYEAEVSCWEEELCRFQEKLLWGVSELDDCFCIYGEAVRELLLEDKGEFSVSALWKKHWHIPEFVDYRRGEWARQLCGYGKGSEFVVLGTAPVLPVLIQDRERQMRSLRCIFREQEETEELQGFFEEWYEESGLAVEVHVLPRSRGYAGVCLEASNPVCVWDFTGEEKLFAGGLAPGSVWLDFNSMEEKEKRLKRLWPEIQYVSLKKVWREGRQ